MTSRWDPRRGSWKLGQLIRAYLEGSEGPVHLDDLLKHLRGLGFYGPSIRRILGQFVEVTADGTCVLRRGSTRGGGSW